ncbi:MAG: dipeptidase [Planctomycetia bacterium]|nr:dipeptidase [Planctomycetia bacterium]
MAKKLHRRTILRRGCTVVAGSLLAGVHLPAVHAGAGSGVVGEAKALHREIPVFIGYLNFAQEQFRADGGRQCDLTKLDAAGVKTFVASIGFGCYFQTGPRQYELAGSNDWLLERQLSRIDDVVATIEKCPRTRLIKTTADLVPRAGDDQIGVIVHLTGNNHTTRLDTVDEFFKRGVRATHPAMQYHNNWCAGHEGRAAPALSEFGRQVVARMNELGIAIDTAHASDDTALALAAVSKRPISDSHTTSRDRVPASRGLRDATLKRLASTGGVIGVLFADHMLTSEAWRTKYSQRPVSPRLWEYNKYLLASTSDPDERMKLRRDKQAQEQFYQDRKLPPDVATPTTRAAALGDLADTIDYLIDTVGIDHVGLGTDINGIDADQWPQGIDHMGDLPVLTAELLRRGYSVDRLRKLLSDNGHRAYGACLPT